MINRNRFSWLGSTLAAAVLALGFTAACDDDPVEEVTPDADVEPEPDACVGHLCGGNETLTRPEGGVLRYELFHTGYDADGNRIESLGGWFFAFTGQDPAIRDIIPAETVPDTPCYDMTGNTYFLNGKTTENQDIINTRTYYDVGETVTITTDAGGAEPIEMTKYENEIDPSTTMTHPIIYKTAPEDAAKLERGAMYELEPIAPAGDFPGLDLQNGADVIMSTVDPALAGWETQALYFPRDFTLDSPTEEEYFYDDPDTADDVEGLQIADNADLTFQWAAEGELPADTPWPVTVQFTGFMTDDRAFKYLCIVPQNQQGGMTIPAKMFDEAQYPDMPRDGKIIHGSLNHIAWNQDDHRFDVVGVNCKFSNYQIYTPATAQ